MKQPTIKDVSPVRQPTIKEEIKEEKPPRVPPKLPEMPKFVGGSTLTTPMGGDHTGNNAAFSSSNPLRESMRSGSGSREREER